MQVSKSSIYFIALLTSSFLAGLLQTSSYGQAINPGLRPDLKRALSGHEDPDGRSRSGSYLPARTKTELALRPRTSDRERANARRSYSSAAKVSSIEPNPPAISPILPGTPLTRILHTSQLSLASSAGTHEQYVDRDNNLVADERTTFDSAGGSFDLAIDQTGARYEVPMALIIPSHGSWSMLATTGSTMPTLWLCCPITIY